MSVGRAANSGDFRRAIASSIAALRSGVSSRSPSGAAKTTFSTPPCSEANSASIRSVAFCVSEPGISNSSRSEPPTVATRTIRTTMMPIQREDDAPRMRGARRAPSARARRSRAARALRAGRFRRGRSYRARRQSSRPSQSFGFVDRVSVRVGGGPAVRGGIIGRDPRGVGAQRAAVDHEANAIGLSAPAGCG